MDDTDEAIRRRMEVYKKTESKVAAAYRLEWGRSIEWDIERTKIERLFIDSLVLNKEDPNETLIPFREAGLGLTIKGDSSDKIWPVVRAQIEDLLEQKRQAKSG